MVYGEAEHGLFLQLTEIRRERDSLKADRDRWRSLAEKATDVLEEAAFYLTTDIQDVSRVKGLAKQALSAFDAMKEPKPICTAVMCFCGKHHKEERNG